VLLLSCEREFVPDEIDAEAKIVVEGYIEAAGSQSTPPYVILTRTLPFFQQLDSTQFGDFFVHDALVIVDNGSDRVQLTEVCLNSLTPEQIALAEEFLGVNIALVPASFCVYLDLSASIIGEEGVTYDLEIQAEGKTLTATTTIPEHVPLQEVNFVDPPGEDTRDSLAQMQVRLIDPPGPNFYRYFVNANNTGYRRDDFSVLNDEFFDGREIVFPLNKPAVDSVDFDLSTFGLFTRGDSIGLKWVTFGEDPFNFWNSLEFAAANQGPFSNSTIVDTNIEGGLGIWSGQAASFTQHVVPME
ncbi:MAG: DUF4249 domain-containing protein, partial [Bacteroidota bacterium]